MPLARPRATLQAQKIRHLASLVCDREGPIVDADDNAALAAAQHELPLHLRVAPGRDERVRRDCAILA